MNPLSCLHRYLGLLSCYLVYMSCAYKLVSGRQCPPVPGREGCVCDHPNGVIDLTPLSNSNGSARFTGLTDTNDYTYQFNPCKTFSVGKLCQDVFICQGTTWDSLVGYEIAKTGTEEIKIDPDGTVYLHYTGPDNRETRVTLICNNNTESGGALVMTAGDTEELYHYVFNLTSSYACPNPSLRTSDSLAGVAGFTLIFLFLAVVAVYFIVGILVKRYKYNATGSDVIPNKDFWWGLPLLIKGGLVFTCCACYKKRDIQYFENEETDPLKESFIA